jgi:hypothetical protein
MGIPPIFCPVIASETNQSVAPVIASEAWQSHKRNRRGRSLLLLLFYFIEPSYLFELFPFLLFSRPFLKVAHGQHRNYLVFPWYF